MNLLGEKKKKDLLLNQLNLCFSVGRRMAQLKKYNDAIFYYDMAMEAEEEEGVEVLVNRSKAYSGLPNHHKAREDAVLAVQRKPEKPSVLENDALSLYEKDHFEEALVGFHRGLRIRQKPDYFRNGVLVATETVEDCVGRHAGDLLDKKYLGDTVLRIWLNEQNLLDPWLARTEQKPAHQRKRLRQSEKYFGEKYLSRLTHDKQFLLSCEDNTNLFSGDLESYADLQNVIKNALKKVDRRQKTLMRYRPMYLYKMAEIERKMSTERKKELDLRKRRGEFSAARLAFQKVNSAREAQLQHNTILCLRTAERAREFIRNQPLRLITDKSVYMSYLYNILGDLYLGMKEFLPHWTQDENDFRILYMFGVKVANECSEEHLRGTFLPYIYDPKRLLAESEKDMVQAGTALERAYLYHEMSRCCNQLEKFELARTMGRRCAQEARPAKSPVWVINGMFMVARFESLQRNYVDAKNTINEAIEVAKKLENDKVLEFLKRSLHLLEFAGQMEVDRNLVLAKREKDMLATMPTRGMKMTMALIFTRMSRLPPSRRMMLVPGVIPTQVKKVRKVKEKRLSVAQQKGSVRDRRRSQACEKDSGRKLNTKTLTVPPARRLSLYK